MMAWLVMVGLFVVVVLFKFTRIKRYAVNARSLSSPMTGSRARRRPSGRSGVHVATFVPLAEPAP